MVIDEEKAKDLARKFLEQYHSIVMLQAILEDSVWEVTARVGIMSKDVKKVNIDADTGRILGYS